MSLVVCMECLLSQWSHLALVKIRNVLVKVSIWHHNSRFASPFSWLADAPADLTNLAVHVDALCKTAGLTGFHTVHIWMPMKECKVERSWSLLYQHALVHNSQNHAKVLSVCLLRLQADYRDDKKRLPIRTSNKRQCLEAYIQKRQHSICRLVLKDK